MAPEIALALGVFLLGLAVLSALAARADRRRPRMALMLAAVSGACIFVAGWGTEGGVRPSDIPMAFYEVIGRMR